MLPKLREVIVKVLDAGNMTQYDLALKLYGDETKQGKISVMMSASDNSGWEKHWQICARLLPLAMALKVITEQDLQPKKRHGNKSDSSDSTARGTKATQR